MAKNKPEAPVKMKLRKGDKVQVLSGAHKGETGEITRVIPERNRVIVEGVNIAKRHQRQTQVNVVGGIIDKDMPLNASAVAIVCSTDGPTRIGYKTDDKGNKTRVCVHCGKEL